MELEQNSDLTLPLFYFDENLHSRDIESPDLLLHVTLSEALLAQLCQNPAVDSSVAIAINEYRLEALNDDFQVLIGGEHSAQLTLVRGPLLSAMLSCENDHTFVSPQVDMMPTFDLGDDVEDIEEEG